MLNNVFPNHHIKILTFIKLYVFTTQHIFLDRRTRLRQILKTERHNIQNCSHIKKVIEIIYIFLTIAIGEIVQ